MTSANTAKGLSLAQVWATIQIRSQSGSVMCRGEGGGPAVLLCVFFYICFKSRHRVSPSVASPRLPHRRKDLHWECTSRRARSDTMEPTCVIARIRPTFKEGCQSVTRVNNLARSNGASIVRKGWECCDGNNKGGTTISGGAADPLCLFGL